MTGYILHRTVNSKKRITTVRQTDAFF